MTLLQAHIDSTKLRHVTVLVPLVGAGSSAFMTVDCIRRSDYSPQRWTASGLGVDPESLEEILTESRDDEEGALALAKVRISVHPRQFVGKSHGLAIALADKLARYSKVDHPTPPIIATGIILTNRRGEIGAVNGFEKKVNLVREKAEIGTVFVYCADNQNDARDLLRIMAAEKNIRLFPVRHLNELSGFWETNEVAILPPGVPRPGKSLLQVASAITALVIVGIISVFMLTDREKQLVKQAAPVAVAPSPEKIQKIVPTEFKGAIEIKKPSAQKISPTHPLP